MDDNINNDSEQLNGIVESQNYRKRRHSATNLESAAFEKTVSDPEIQLVGDGPSVAKYHGVDWSPQFLLDQFSDEVLYEIFKHLDSWSLLALMNCCHRFHTLVLDRRFWIHIDLSKEALPLGIIEDVLERTHQKTSCIKLHGPAPAQHVDGEIKQFNQILSATFSQRCTQLRVLELQGIIIDFHHVRIVDFPKTLKRLILNDCSIRVPSNTKSIFAGMDTHLKDLEELGIEYSDWFEPYYIMIFSKSPALRWLSLKGCQLLSEFVPYGSMAARFGFKQLEYLDLRFTPITDSDLQCFNAVVTLKEILLDCPDDVRCVHERTVEPTLESSNDDCRASTSSGTAQSAQTSSSDKDTPSTSGSSSQVDVTIALRLPTANPRSPAISSSSTSSSSFSLPSSPSLLSTSSSSSSSSSHTSPEVSPPHLNQAPADNNNRGANNDPPPVNFFPRHDQYIYLDLQQQRRPFIRFGMPRRPLNNGNHLDQVLNHPLFWDMINPLGRPGRPMAHLLPFVEAAGVAEQIAIAEPVAAAAGVRSPRCLFYNRLQTRRRCHISDRGICCFGRPQNPVEQGIIWIRIGNRPMENRFERLVVRNYKEVTDISLQHLVQCSPYLVYLDLSGSSVTRDGIQKFKDQKPECQIIADHLIDVPEE